MALRHVIDSSLNNGTPGAEGIGGFARAQISIALPDMQPPIGNRCQSLSFGSEP